MFYNCTWPRFGPQCQYELDNREFHSLKGYINTYHVHNDWSHTNWTCYIHLECIRSPGMRCLDWTDICNGQIDCLNNGIDEEHCWQLEMNVCQNDEYRCYDGLCVPKYFLRTANVVIQNEYKQTHFQCPNSNKFIPHWKLENGNCDCDTNDKVYCEIYDRNILWFSGPTQAGEFCNGVIDFKPILINGKNLTDETDCEHRVTKKNVRTHLQSSSSSDSKYSLMKTLKHCHFGISLHVWLDSKKQLSKLTCLCPSNYYGSQCQYQNQRVLLRIAFDTSYNRLNTAFLISISLIDNSNERMIHSHEQFTETRTDYCRFENSLNLFYSCGYLRKNIIQISSKLFIYN